MTDELLTPGEAKEAMGGMVVPEEVADYWWELTQKLLGAQLAKAKTLLEAEHKAEIRQLISIIREYKLESASVRDDVLGEKAIGWKLLWQVLKSRYGGE